MIANTLDVTVQLVESYQRECPEIYQDNELILEDLKSHMKKVSCLLMITELKLNARFQYKADIRVVRRKTIKVN